MIRKTMTAVTVAGALALGTASATSLGSFDDVSFAASSIDLDNCLVAVDPGGILALVPDVPSVGDSLALVDTLLVDTLDLTTLVANLPTTCSGDLIDLVVTAVDGTVLGLAEGIDATLPAEYGAVALVDEAAALVSVDIAAIDNVRVVVRN